ncbi:hypothetical protein [Pyrococcus horikoshii]|uniref:Uncharacterized protein n=1 Tax=Pyrococcus horikoshii (strain ATCC 700860 / DSM 12428 / JCM 9974 / NBRC 100139 / OT-3) TaxID=70601 RepID=O73998_PYRHO|nr:hypothetical protein [Pyrococcus horikoshii]BAA30130.1 57aa long hypothetical protein [Pyrococcus horikoshii OT3]
MEEILQSIDEDTKRKFSKAPGYTLEYILHALEWIFEQEYRLKRDTKVENWHIRCSLM